MNAMTIARGGDGMIGVVATNAMDAGCPSCVGPLRAWAYDAYPRADTMASRDDVERAEAPTPVRSGGLPAGTH